jgi:4-amino-4-deoxy-L-arabinose transferase-like glycosyltransferase
VDLQYDSIRSQILLLTGIVGGKLTRQVLAGFMSLMELTRFILDTMMFRNPNCYNNPEGWRFVEFPLYNAVHALLYKAVPSINFEVWGRLVSITSALVTAFALYRLVTLQLNKRAGMFAAFFYLFIPFNIYFTRVILPDPMGTMWVTLSLWMFFAFYKSDKKYQLFLSAIFFGLAMLIKPFAIFYTIPFILAVHKKWGFKKVAFSIPFLIALDLALVPFFAWRAWMNNYIVGIPYFAWMFNGDGIRFRPSFWFWIFGQRLGRLVLGDWGIVPFIFGLLTSLKAFLAASFGMFCMFQPLHRKCSS